MEQDKAQKVLDDLKGAFEALASTEAFLDWYDTAYLCEAYYEGKQWTDVEKEAIEEQLGVPVVTINKIASRIRNALGQEIKSRTKIVYRSRSGNENEEATAEALTDLAYYFQDTNRSPYILSQVAKDMLVAGVGFHEFMPENGSITEQALNPLNSVWDVTDTTPDLTNQNAFFKFQWVSREQLKSRFPDKAEELNKLNEDSAAVDPTIWPQKKLGDFFALKNNKGYFDGKMDTLCVVCAYYRMPAKYYVCHTNDDRIVTTFDKQEAEQISKRGSDPIEQNGYQVFVGYFTGDVLLDHYEYPYQMNPMYGWMPVTAMVAEREATTGMPYGVVRQALNAQAVRNKTETRLNWYMAASQVVADANAIDSVETTREEINRADGIILKRQGAELRIERHENRIQTHLARLQVLDQAIQDTMGIYDEALGVETNASSGVAIQRRQTGASNNLAIYFDKIRQCRLTWGRKLLCLVQQVMDTQRVFYITDDMGASRAVRVNEPVYDENGKPMKDESGKPIVKSDIKTGEYDVYLEEVADLSSQNDEWRDRILKIVERYGPQIMAQPQIFKSVAKLAGVPSSALDALMQDMQEFDGGQAGNGAMQGLTQSLPAGGLPNTGQ